MRGATLVMVASAIAVGQMGHDFQHQQVGPRHYMPGTAIAERPDQFLQHMHMQLHGTLGRYIRFGQQVRKLRHFIGEVAGTHDDIGPQQFAVMGDETLGKIRGSKRGRKGERERG